MNVLEDLDVFEWYYKPDDSLIKDKRFSYWIIFYESDMIEKAFQIYLSNLNNYKNQSLRKYYLKNWKIYVDFEEIFRLETSLLDNKTILKRSKSNPNKSSVNDQYSFSKLIEESNFSSERDENVITSAILLNENESFTDYINLDTVLKITEKAKLNKQSKDDIISFSDTYLREQKLSYIQEFEEFKDKIEIDSVEPCLWYSKPIFLYSMINNVLRKRDFIQIFKIRYFISLLYSKLSSLSNENKYKDCLYRGSILPKSELKKMKNSINYPFLLKGFISTSSSLDIAETFRIQLRKDGYESILYIIEPNENDVKKYCSIREFSAIKYENEYLININTFLKITKIEEIENAKETYYKIYIKFSDENDLYNKKNKSIIDYKNYIGNIKNIEYTIDAFYLARIFAHLLQGTNIIRVLENVKCNSLEEEAHLYNFLGLGNSFIGNYIDAIKLTLKSLKIRVDKFGETNSDTGTSYHNVGSSYNNNAEYDQALKYYKKAIEIRENLENKNFGSIAISYHNMGITYNNMGEFEKGLEILKKAVEMSKNYRGKIHSDTANCILNEGISYLKLGDHAKAFINFNEAYKMYNETLGPDNIRIANTLTQLGIYYEKMGDYHKSLDFFNKACKIRENLLSKNNPQILSSYDDIGRIYLKQNKLDDAIVKFSHALVNREIILRENHPEIANSFQNIGEYYIKIKNKDLAQENLLKAYEIRKISLGENHPDTKNSHSALNSVFNKIIKD